MGALLLLLAATLAPTAQDPLLPPGGRLVPVPAKDVHLAEGSFWGPRVATNLLVSLRHGAAMLEEHGQFGNFRLAAATLGHAIPGGVAPPDEYAGVHYYDSDAYKWLEACCLALEQEAPGGTDAAAVAAARADIRARVDRFVEEIAAAQREDGYIQTQYVVKGQEPWSNLHDDHELYCAGHLIQAASAHHRATGSRRLLDVALRFADLIDRTFGPDVAAGERPGCCGHPEIETALVQLADHTGDRRWLDLAAYFLEARGRGILRGDLLLQDHALIREQRTATGHAVRQLYLCSGVLGVGSRTGDASLVDANLAIWDDIVRGKLYVTGGLGARPDGEAFGEPFELPNDRAYSETCASIAWMRWNHELLSATGDARFAEALETTLYNAFLAAVGHDGKSFFYVNPLESRGGHVRQPWFWCACCPPNVMRTLAGLPGWVASTTSDTLWIHLYDDCVIDATLGDGRRVKVAVETAWPWDQTVQVRFLESARGPLGLALRVPAMVGQASVKLMPRGLRVSDPSPGFDDARPGPRVVRLEDEFEPGDVVQLMLPTRVERLTADARVLADIGQLAIRRGPVVYAFVAQDQHEPIETLRIVPDRPASVVRGVSGGVRHIVLDGLCISSDGATALYTERTANVAPSLLQASPYFTWADRGDAGLRVWMPLEMDDHSFAADVAFIADHAHVTVLRAEGCGPVAVAPALEGRVMTSAFGETGPGFGLVNRAAILAGPRDTRFANYGGEDRLWLSPEGGPHALFFEPGSAQTADNWFVPSFGSKTGVLLSERPSATRIILAPTAVRVRDQAGTWLDLTVDRTIEALSRSEVAACLGLPDLDDVFRIVAFRSINSLTWSGAPPAHALVGLWVLGQFNPSARTTVLFPFRGGAAVPDASPQDSAAAAIKRDYFGVVPDERLQVLLPASPRAFGLARFQADGRLRSKIGLSAAAATGWIGAWDEDRGVLTLVNHTLPPPGAPVPDCDWKVPNPRAMRGDVATSYNHGGEPRFFELESLSAALPLEDGASIEHVHTTIHLGGDRRALADIARAVLHAEL